MVHTLRVQPRAGIPHGDEHAVRGVSPGADPQFPRPLVDAAHGFDRIEDQVEDHLLQLDAIAFDERQVRRELGLQRDAMLQHFAAGQGDDVEDGLIDVEPSLARGRLLDEGTDPVDDIAGTPAVLDDTAEGLADLLQIGRFSRRASARRPRRW